MSQECRNARDAMHVTQRKNVDCVVTWIALETWRNASSGSAWRKQSAIMRPPQIYQSLYETWRKFDNTVTTRDPNKFIAQIVKSCTIMVCFSI